jgi:sucrose phosphorylase
LKSRLSQPKSREAQVLSNYLHLLNIRRQQSAFHPLASQEVILSDHGIFSIVRRSLNGKQTILCLVNVTPASRQFCLDRQSDMLSSDSSWQDLIGGQKYVATPAGLEVNLKPYQSCWLTAASN